MDIKGDWKKRALSGLMALIMALSLLPTSILAADTRSVTDNAIKNGSFEEPEFVTDSSPQWPANEVPDWNTTAFDQLIEFGSSRNSGKPPQLTGDNKNIPDGNQFAELNAEEESTLYQYATTVGGNVYEWGLSHRGRMGIDQMALIIGPKQAVNPAKPSENGRDQFMRMTDWVRQNASNLKVTIPQTGCTEKITVYSKKFAANGGFQNDIGDSAFSALPSDVYTEKWNVWIIGTNNKAWGNYGTKSTTDYAAGTLTYSCRYAVPDGQAETVFAFCSYSATGGSTCGNLIDNIHFSLHQTITAAATAGGWGNIRVSTDGKNENYEIDGSMRELVVADGSTITVQAVEPESGDVQFVGAYVTRQTQNGLEKEFIPATRDDYWKQEGKTYTYKHSVEEPADIVLVFVKKPMVIYEANGGDQYTHGDNGTNAVSFAQKMNGDGSITERDPYVSKAAETNKDGWRFDGWLLARKKKVLPAVHTVSYDTENATFTFKAGDTNETLEAGGATLIAQWKWRQRFVTASRVKENGEVSADIRENTACGSITVKSDGSTASTETSGAVTDYYSQANEKITATAAAKNGYLFVGWYQQLDGDTYQFISNQETYTYTAKAEGVQTIYARFAPTHTVTYQWASTPNECPTEEELNAAKKTLPAAATVMDGDNYLISTDYEANKTSIPGTKQENDVTVYGEWTFTGWHDEKGNICGGNLADVRKDLTLTGYWTFVLNTQYTLTYQVAENGSWTPSNLSALAAAKQYFRTEPVTAASAPTYTPDELYVDSELTLKGTWTFGGWKRSDTGKIIEENSEFEMPGDNVTLTGQWSFVPDTYTVSYDLNGGAGTAPLPHDSYDYSALEKKNGCDTKKSGIPFGASVTLRNFSGTAPEGTYFAGWSLVDPATVKDVNAIQTQDPGDSVGYRKLEITENGQEVKLYAVYKNKDVATVDFAVNDSNWGDVNTKSGSFMVQNGKVDVNTVSSTATPREGYHFVGWYDESDDGELKNGATLTVTSNMMQEKLKPLTGSGGENGTPVLVVRYVAVFEPNTFTIHYEPNYPADGIDESGEMADQTFNTANASRNLSANQFQCKGYTFAGWTTQSDGSGDFYSDGEAFTQTVGHNETVPLYAKWERLPDVTITYTAYPDSLGSVALNPKSEAAAGINADAQDGLIYEKLNPETGEVQGAKAVPGEGSVFVGWYDAQDTERKDPLTDSTTYTPEKDSSGRYQSASYVALFRQKQYVLHYDANADDAAGTMEDQTFGHGQSLPLNECLFSREGYDFMGWALSKKGKKQFSDKEDVQFTVLVPSGSELNDGDRATLYAVWQERNVTLNYASSDESLSTVTVGSETIGAATGTPAGSTAQPKSGARFDGWYSADGTLLSKELTFVPTKEAGTVWQGTTYYARFSARPRPSTPSTPAKPDDTKITLAPIPEMLNGKDHYAYLLGYEDGTVRPNGNISRAEVATVLFRLIKDDVRMQNLTKDNAYSDVSGTAWYGAAVSTLSKMGVISGYPDGTFRPNAPITRAEFAAMIARFDETAKAVDTPFTDIAGHWAESAIGKAYGSGWIKGSSKTVFCPESNLTRAETATLLNRVLHRLPEKESDLLANQIVWPDNPKTFWGYLAMQEATNSHEYERKADGVHETQTAKRENRDWSKEFEQ